jgi:hypothetical protein
MAIIWIDYVIRDDDRLIVDSSGQQCINNVAKEILAPIDDGQSRNH